MNNKITKFSFHGILMGKLELEVMTYDADEKLKENWSNISG
jgi:hypothetical protein